MDKNKNNGNNNPGIIANIEGKSGDQTMAMIDFNNTQIAFADKSDQELKKTAWLFGLMNRHWLVGIGAKVGMAAIKLHLPFVEGVVKNTIFNQFCGGTSLLSSQPTIERLAAFNIGSVLDYGAEGKEDEEDLNQTMNENIRALEFASQNDGAWLISTKISGLAQNTLLEKVSSGVELSSEEIEEWKAVRKRVDAVCNKAAQLGVSVFIDAEETWLQPAIDELAFIMMERYNSERAVVYTTFQMYRTDQLQFLKDSCRRAEEYGFVLGAKLVRGAYMEKERERAAQKGYPSPIHPDKAATDAAFNAGIRFCLEHYDRIAFCNATHNQESSRLMAEALAELNIPADHPHAMFCQLYGMSDNLTFNLAAAGYRVAKYVVYGSVREVVPYLIRRAEENSSVTGDMTREHKLVISELKRRGLQ